MNLPLDMPTVLAGLSALTVAVTFCLGALVLSAGSQGRRYRRRLAALQDRARGTPIANAGAARSLARRTSATPNIDRAARKWLPRRELLEARLMRTGRSIGVGQYLIANVAVIAPVSLGLIIATPIGVLPSLLVGLFLGTLLPHMVIGRMGRRRVRAFVSQFPEAIELMVRALRSGLPISEAIIGAAHEIPDPVGAELRMVEQGMKLGRDLDSLLWDIAKRIDNPEFRFFIIALSVQRETGGNLAETLSNLADVLRRRRQMQAKVRAMASETRATAAVLGGLPIVVILLLLVSSPGYLAPLYTDVRGLILDGIALTMLVSGLLLMNRMARFEI